MLPRECLCTGHCAQFYHQLKQHLGVSFEGTGLDAKDSEVMLFAMQQHIEVLP